MLLPSCRLKKFCIKIIIRSMFRFRHWSRIDPSPQPPHISLALGAATAVVSVLPILPPSVFHLFPTTVFRLTFSSSAPQSDSADSPSIVSRSSALSPRPRSIVRPTEDTVSSTFDTRYGVSALFSSGPGTCDSTTITKRGHGSYAFARLNDRHCRAIGSGVSGKHIPLALDICQTYSHSLTDVSTAPPRVVIRVPWHTPYGKKKKKNI